MGILIRIFLTVVIALLAVILVFLVSKFTVFISFTKNSGQKYKFSADCMLFWNLVKIRIPISQKKTSPKRVSDESVKNDIGFVQKVKLYYKSFCTAMEVYRKISPKIRKAVLIKDIDISVSFGLGDAAKTGVATGTLWAAIYNVIAILSRIATLTEPKVGVEPLYNDFKCEAKASCMLRCRPANLVILYFKYRKIIKKIIKKGGE